MAISNDVMPMVRAESLSVAKRLLRIEADAVRALEERINGEFARAVRLLADISGHVIVSGMGKSGLVGRKISATLASTGTPSSFLHPTEAVHGDLGMVTRQDATLIISKSGGTDELQTLVPYFKLLNIPIVGMLGNLNSPLAEKCDIVLDVSVVEEGCPLDLAPTASTTALLAMGDALAVALLTEKRFRPEDFAFLHPGGALGRRLAMQVKDIMHTGDNIPVVTVTAPMADVIMEMTRKRLGAACILDEKGKLLGSFTDGDLRRALERGMDFSKTTAGDVAIRKPKTVDAEILAARAINIMEVHNILVLPVTDDNGKLVGIVHLHDLLKSGIGK